MAGVSRFSPRKNNNTYLYTKGGELSLDGKNYIGEYHLDGTIAKTGPIQTDDSKVLHRNYPNPDHYTYEKLFKFRVPVMDFVDPVPYLYTPTQQAYSVGFDSRFFVEKIDDDGSYAIEINQIQFTNLGKKYGIDNGLYASGEVNWQLTGRRDEIISHNEKELSKLTPKLPTILYTVKNYLEYARITLV